jgi:hypothetical protein
MSTPINQLTAQEMADKLYQQVYGLMPDSTTWLPNDLIDNIVRESISLVLIQVIDNISNDKDILYCQEVLTIIKK